MAESLPLPVQLVGSTLLQFEVIINAGAFGTVYRGRIDSQTVAVKAVPVNASTNWQTLEHELQLCRQLRHPYIVHTYDIAYTRAAVYVIQEFCARGDLFEVISPLVGIGDEQRIKKYVRQLVDATAFLHSEGMVHRDLKPENVVLTANDDVRLTDFGLSGPADDDVEPCVGTVPYMAPEVYHGSVHEKPNGKAADVFSLGVVIHVMICGCYPWDTPSRHEPAFDSFIRNGHSFGHKQWAQIVNDIFSGCLHSNPRRRLAAAELLELVSRDGAWNLYCHVDKAYAKPLGYLVVPEDEYGLQGPTFGDGSAGLDIVFTDEFQNSRSSSVEDAIQYSMPEEFNPLVDVPRRRTRVVSECDSGVDIRFDSDTETGRLYSGLRSKTGQSDIDDDSQESSAGAWLHRDEGNAMKQSGDFWGDQTKDMSFTTIPVFDTTYPPPRPRGSSSTPSKPGERRWSNMDWGDMSYMDMSFSSFPQFDVGWASSGGQAALVSRASASKDSCLFTLGEADVDFACDSVVSGVTTSSDDSLENGSDAKETGSTDRLPPFSSSCDESTESVDHSSSDGSRWWPRKLLETRSIDALSATPSMLSLQQLSPAHFLSSMLRGACVPFSCLTSQCSGTSCSRCVAETCGPSMFYATAVDLRKAMSCINLATW